MYIYGPCVRMVQPRPPKTGGTGASQGLYIHQTRPSLLPGSFFYSRPVSIKSYIFFCVYQHKIVYVLVPLWYFKAPFVVVPGKEIVKACKDGNGKKPHEICSHLSLRLSILQVRLEWKRIDHVFY